MSLLNADQTDEAAVNNCVHNGGVVKTSEITNAMRLWPAGTLSLYPSGIKQT